MPWRECYQMDERLRFVARLLDGEKMAVLCREFDISRKTPPLPHPELASVARRRFSSGAQGIRGRTLVG